MVPASFDESTHNAQAPPGYVPIPGIPDIVAVSPVLYGDEERQIPLLVSCWKMTKLELDELHRTGRIWLSVVGDHMPSVIMSPFKPPLPPAPLTDESLPAPVEPKPPSDDFNPSWN